MNLLELRDRINAHLDANPRHKDQKVVVLVTGGGVGARPNVPVKHANSGFDWEAGYFIITPEVSLTKASK